MNILNSKKNKIYMMKLKANNLVVIDSLFTITTKLIANKASFRTKRQSIEKLITVKIVA